MTHELFRIFLSDEAKAKGVKLQTPRDSDAGFDLPSFEDVTIPPRSFRLLRTGVHMAIPMGFTGILRDRSSIGLRGGAITAGVIDSSYRGEVKIVMHNLSDEPLAFKMGERIGQCVVLPHLMASQSVEVSSLTELGETERGSGGFGSTGK